MTPGSPLALPPADPALLVVCSDFAHEVCNYVTTRYVGPEGRRWLWAALAAAHALGAQTRVRLFTGVLGLWHKQRGYMQDALRYYEQSLAVTVAQDDKREQATMLTNIGTVWWSLGDPRKALEYYERALPLREQVGDRRGEAYTLSNIGSAWMALGDNQKALDYYERALPLRQEVGDRSGEAATLAAMGVSYAALGDQQKALDYYERALPLRQQVGDIYGEAVTRSNMARVLWDQERRDEAIVHMRTARALNARMGISTATQDDWLRQWGVKPEEP